MAVVLFRWGKAIRSECSVFDFSATSCRSNVRLYEIKTQQWFLPCSLGIVHGVFKKRWVPAGDNEVTPEQKVIALLYT